MSECRICLESNNAEDFITPCKCSGTTAVVHEKCLQRWRAECYGNPDKYNKCELCNEEYIIVRENAPETLFFCNKHPIKVRYWFLTISIMTISLLIGLIDTVNNYASIKIIGLRRAEKNLREILVVDPWANISYYQSMTTFLFSMGVIIFIKLSAIFLVQQRCRYSKLMFLSDFSYALTLIPYPFLILTTHNLGITGLLCSTGAFLILLTVPMTSDYCNKHNKTLEEINRRYSREHIMNITYNPLPPDHTYHYESSIIELA